MSEDDPVRRAAQYRVDRESAREAARVTRRARASPRHTRPPLENRGQWVDELVRQAMARASSTTCRSRASRSRARHPPRPRLVAQEPGRAREHHRDPASGPAPA
ncbi:hypothetical protein NKG05_12225 [Oerskovia sp. M15]